MENSEIIRRLEKIAQNAVHTPGEPPLILSLDDGLALHTAIEIVKYQEPVKPKKEYWYNGKKWASLCGMCGALLNTRDKFCHECGRVVKWE